MADFIYGINPVKEGLVGRRRPQELFVDEGGERARIDELLDLAGEQGVPVRRRRREDLTRLVGNAHHQGAVLRIEEFKYVPFEELLADWQASAKTGLFLLVDGITDPHNLGAILRNADAAGCQGVVIPKDRNCPITNVVDKASAGAVEHLPVCQIVNLARTIQQLKEAGVWVYGLATEQAGTSLYTENLQGHLALVVGSEGQGLRQRTRQLCDGLLEIPMRGGVASLNASAATAVALFEVVRQRLTR
ncbi:MAG TPA: 23S rRNA (guanosine(2251)-2'-O)-methyltransferase RlmB [Desulfuromonadales bacterium]|nr:23S rRNA (guanosine(2251)-2'-O)-methyltransferase RlmB [Desulfuromonadales bacterium]